MVNHNRAMGMIKIGEFYEVDGRLRSFFLLP